MHGLQTKRIVILVGASILLLDRAIKIYFWQNRSDFQDGFFAVTINPLGSFSVAWPHYLWWPLAVIIIFFCLLQAVQLFHNKQNYWPWILIVLGASSNMVDRLFYGGVIDYIKLGWWPVFNLSDSLIVMGAAWLLLAGVSDSLRQRLKPQ